MSERKYTKGGLVYSVGCFEALGTKWFIVNGKTMHRSFLESMTYRTLAGFIRRRQVYEALPNELIGKGFRNLTVEEWK